MGDKKPTAAKRTAKKQVMLIGNLFDKRRVHTFDTKTGEEIPKPHPKPRKPKDPQTKLKL